MHELATLPYDFYQVVMVLDFHQTPNVVDADADIDDVVQQMSYSLDWNCFEWFLALAVSFYLSFAVNWPLAYRDVVMDLHGV